MSARLTSFALLLYGVAVTASAAADNDSLEALIDAGNGKSVAAQMEARVDAGDASAEVHYWLARGQLAQIDEAWVLRKLTLAKDAKSHLETALSLDPTHAPTRRALGQYYLEAPALAGGSIEKAAAQADALMTLDEGEGYALKAAIARAEDDEALAIDYERRALNTGPWTWERQYALAARSVSFALPDAMTLLKEAEHNVRKHESDPATHLRLLDYQRGKLAATTGQNLKVGMEGLQRYLSYEPGPDDPALVWAQFRLAQVERQLGRTDEARARLAQLEAMDVEKDLGFALQDERRWHYGE